MSDSEVSFQQSDDEGSDFGIVASPAAKKKVAAKPKKAPAAKATTSAAKGKAKATPAAGAKVRTQAANHDCYADKHSPVQKTAVGAAAKKKAPLKTKKNAPNNSMSDDDVSVVSDGDVDMHGSDSDEEFGSKRARPAVQQAKGPQKTASEMYQKVSLWIPTGGNSTDFDLFDSSRNWNIS
jgi:hypothetical protein